MSLSPSATASNMNEQNITLIYVFNAISIFGSAFLLFILISAWRSPSVRRSSTWYCFITHWLIFDLAGLFLLGRQTGDEPSFGLCLVQASFHYAVPVLTGFGSVALVLQLYLAMCMTDLDNRPAAKSKGIYLLWTIPPSIAGLFCIEGIIYGLEKPGVVRRSSSGTACEFSDGVSTKISSSLVMLSMVSMTIIEICILSSFHRNCRALKQSKGNVERDFIKRYRSATTRTFFLFLAQVMSFSLGLMVWFTKTWTPLSNARSNIACAMMPLIVAIIFGTQKDLWKAWMIRKKNDVFDTTDKSGWYSFV
ncbi:hypothetical protein K435DRAFT_785680 [Dendrothele bispora CBS 962.96]|uniref:G-protein coupled receptors family 1 profile domain-containing protein n=1 Tax=Dendrothele bispora (strain CBS 962.96) TaxID=1314807 RepID=A0A4S8KVF8_DENBC|nr:hypothetical protein K435DRAFT_785680 [Dendrothele bispora CBS 962.96]